MFHLSLVLQLDVLVHVVVEILIHHCGSPPVFVEVDNLSHIVCIGAEFSPQVLQQLGPFSYFLL